MYEDDLKQFGLTHSETLWERLSDQRFDEMFADSAVMDCSVDTNTWGEFVFVDLRRNDMTLTFYGWGYHETADRYLLDWKVFRCDTPYQKANTTRKKALEIIQRRRDQVRRWASDHKQSEHGLLFDLLADGSDEDGTLAFMEDFDL